MIFVGVFFVILVSIGICLFFVFNSFMEYKLAKTGVKHTANIVRVSFGHQESDKAYIEYFVNGKKYEGCISGDYKKGQVVDIFYDASNPKSFTDGKTGVIAIGISFIPMLISLIVLVGFFVVMKMT